MPPRRSTKKKTTRANERSGGSGIGTEEVQGSKRAKFSPPTEAQAAAAAAATAATASRQDHHDRSTQILFLVLENLRARANAERPKDDDGDTAVAEAWHRIARRSADAGASSEASSDESSDEDDDDDDDSRNNNTNNINAARLFVGTCLSASRVCRDWRQVAFGAAQEAVVRLVDDDESSQPPTRRGKPPRRDPLSALTPYVDSNGRGSVLRALWLRGPLPDPARLRSLARALGVVVQPTTTGDSSNTCRLFPGDASLASLLRRLHVLRVCYSWPLIYALSGVALSPSPPSPPLLGNLVHLELHAYESRWAPPPPSSSRANAPHFFTRQQLPSLKALSVSLTEDSDCPFDLLGHGDAPPPALTLLRATKASPTPAPRWRGRWPPGEPLLVSLRTLRALAPSLRVLHAGRTWCSSSSENVVREPPSTGDNNNDDDEAPIPQPARASLVRDELIVWRLANPSKNQDPPPQHLQPMARLRRGIAPLTQLRILRLDSSYDCLPEMAIVGGGADLHPGSPAWHQLRRARVREWQQASRAVLAPLGSSLAELDLSSARRRGVVSGLLALPSALSLLLAWTRLDVAAGKVVSVGKGLRAMTWLRHLSIRALRYQDSEDDEADEEEEEDEDDEDEEDAGGPLTHPPLHAEDLTDLSKLTFLELSHAAMCVADPIKQGLPALRVLSLSTRGGCDCCGCEDELRDPPLCVLKAALERAQKPNGGGLSMRLAKLPRDVINGGNPYVRWPVAREVDEEELEELVHGHAGDGARREARHELYHAVLAVELAELAGVEGEDEGL